MKIFAVYLTIDLTTKPDWLDNFRHRNDAWSAFHITLIQPRFIEDNQIENVKAEASDFIKKRQLTLDDKQLIFDKVFFEENSDGKYLIMWFAKENLKLVRLQSDLYNLFNDCGKYVDGSTIEYETNFRPHITIAENINADQKIEIEKLLTLNSKCEGVIKSLALPIVKNTSREERENSSNIILFEL
jgi:2'-5' RNA ligase